MFISFYKIIPVIIIVLVFIILRLLSGSENDDYANNDIGNYDDNSTVNNVDSKENETDNNSLEASEQNTTNDQSSEANVDDQIENNDLKVDNTAEFIYTFRKQSLFEQHFEKHGAEMGYSNKEDYLAGANRVINDPNSLHKTEEEDGDDIYYLESTNEIVFVSQDGYIRTYFNPSRGIDYYNKQ